MEHINAHSKHTHTYIPFAKHIFGTHGNDVRGGVYSENTSGSTSGPLPAKHIPYKSHVPKSTNPTSHHHDPFSLLNDRE